MNPFKKSADSFVRESSSILHVFSKTLRKLNAVNEKIVQKENEVELEISDLQADLSSLKKVRASNANIITKISNLIE